MEKEKAEREAEITLVFKRDCRRTALQLSERFTRDNEGGKGSVEVSKILANAELTYAWLVNIPPDDKTPPDWLNSFFNTGVLTYNNK
jgi:hypothetical protein